MNTRVKIIGVGSPFGDDRLGWVAAEQLQDSPAIRSTSGRIEVSVLDRPGAAIISQWNGANTVILIDAVHSGAAPGSVHCLAADGLDASWDTMSSHGFGIASTLALARTLGELPNRLYVCGIELDPAHTSGDLSPAVRAALPRLLHRIKALASGIHEPLSTPAQTV